MIHGVSNLEQILTNSASGMSAQSVRMNTIASNLANSDSVGSSSESTYHVKYPIFSEVVNKVNGLANGEQPIGGVRVTDIKQTEKELEKRYEPDNPLANEQGFVYLTDVNPVEEMTNMISASKDYQANVEMMNTAKNMILQSLDAIRGT